MPLVYPGVTAGTVTQWIAVTAGINTTVTPLWGGFTGLGQVDFVYGSDFRYRFDVREKTAGDLRAHADGTLFAVDRLTGKAMNPTTITSGSTTQWNATVDSFVAGFGRNWQTSPAVSVSKWGGASVFINPDQGASLGTFGVQVHRYTPSYYLPHFSH